MFTETSLHKTIFTAFFIGCLALTACSTQGASRYGDAPSHVGTAPCGPTVTPCVQGYYQPVVPMDYNLAAPCQGAQCAPIYPAYNAESMIEIQPPIPQTTITATPEPSIYEAPAFDPLAVLPPIRNPRPVIDEPVDISCPEGSILGYGGQGCIPISIPRK